MEDFEINRFDKTETKGEARLLTIKTFDFISKLGDAYFVVYNTLNIIKRGDVQKFIVNTMMQGIDRTLQELEDKKIFNADDPTKIEALKIQVIQQIRGTNIKKVQEYEPILLNQNLVMLCTIMEIFFIHVLETIMIKDPRTIIGLSLEKNISLEQVMQLKTNSAVINDFKIKIIDHFSRQGLKEKFKIYAKIMPNIDEVFDFSSFTDDAQQRLSTFNMAKLNEIFDKRHDIVHKNELPLKDLNGLDQVKDFFEKIIFNLSTIAMYKYNILLDIQEPLVRAGFPLEKMPGQQKKIT